MKRRLPFAVPGSHTYLTLPRIRALESHPFTLLNANEVVVASFNGFTKALHEYAVKNPGASLLVSLDGPYGTVPDFASFTKVVFIAGGSGASFTAGVAVSLLRKLGNSTKTTIDFTWVMKDEGRDSYLKYYGCQLR
jgi:predicted ferric reductase